MESAEVQRVSPQATRSCHARLLVVDNRLLNAKARDANDSPRRRDIHSLHTGDADPLQRMLNAIQPGSYVRPHRHVEPPKAEIVVILQGSLGCVFFDDHGEPRKSELVVLNARRGVFALDTRANVWHTILALEPDTVVLEAKPGPYNAGTDKEFASWSPPEHSAEAPAYLMRLEDMLRQTCGLPRRVWGRAERS